MQRGSERDFKSYTGRNQEGKEMKNYKFRDIGGMGSWGIGGMGWRPSDK
jgi:hypothetical protein